jgi:hypothetical protein
MQRRRGCRHLERIPKASRCFDERENRNTGTAHVDDLRDVFGALGLGQHDAHDPLARARPKVSVEPLATGSIDPNEHRVIRRQPIRQRAPRTSLLAWRDGILEVDDDGIRIRRASLGVAIRSIGRNEQVGATHAKR